MAEKNAQKSKESRCVWTISFYSKLFKWQMVELRKNLFRTLLRDRQLFKGGLLKDTYKLAPSMRFCCMGKRSGSAPNLRKSGNPQSQGIGWGLWIEKYYEKAPGIRRGSG